MLFYTNRNKKKCQKTSFARNMLDKYVKIL